MNDKDFIVYKHTSPSGKAYVGITCQQPTHRWRYGKGYKFNQHFTSAVEKYGWDNFKHEILFSGLTEKEAQKKEVDIIEKYNLTDRRYGYNITPGGTSSSGMKGKKHSEATKRKMSLAHKGFKHTEESRQRMCDAQKGHKVTKAATEAHIRARSIPVLCVETGVIYKNAQDVERFFGVNPRHIYEVCKGKTNRKTAGGFHWKQVSVREV